MLFLFTKIQNNGIISLIKVETIIVEEVKYVWFFQEKEEQRLSNT